MNHGRGKSPSGATLRMLCGKAAGMCQFRGCMERLFYDNLTQEKFFKAHVTHIVASSPGGPRGDPAISHKMSDNIENLMLMCLNHHDMVDRMHGKYTIDVLREMKREHEERVEKICHLFYVPYSNLLLFTSPIKGENLAIIDHNSAARAIITQNKQPVSIYGIPIHIKSAYDYRSRDYWEDVQTQLQYVFKGRICSLISSDPQIHFSVFPLAPIPLIIKLGEIMGDKTPMDVYQKKRIPDTWEWSSEVQTNSFTVQTLVKGKGDSIALLLSLTNDIDVARIPRLISITSIYKVKSATTGVDCISSKDDLSAFWHSYQDVCELILNNHGKNCVIHLFPAVPVSAAFEVGRRYMPGVYPKMKIFDDNSGFFETLMVGG